MSGGTHALARACCVLYLLAHSLLLYSKISFADFMLGVQVAAPSVVLYWLVLFGCLELLPLHPAVSLRGLYAALTIRSHAGERVGVPARRLGSGGSSSVELRWRRPVGGEIALGNAWRRQQRWRRRARSVTARSLFRDPGKCHCAAAAAARFLSAFKRRRGGRMGAGTSKWAAPKATANANGGKPRHTVLIILYRVALCEHALAVAFFLLN